jgi:ankyrin repeat protein
MADLLSPTSISSLTTMASDTLVLKQLFDLWNSSFSGGTNIFKQLILSCFKGLGVFLIQYLAKNPDKIMSFLRLLALKLVYRRLELKAVPGTKEAVLQKIINKEVNPKNEVSASLTLSGMPMYYSVQGAHSTLEYCPILHQKFLTDTTTEADLELQNESRPKGEKELKTICRDASRKPFDPDILFPSANYERLDTIIETFFMVVKRTKMYKAQGILIDGEPGLGKSKSCDYLASLNKYHEVNYVNLSLTELLKKDFLTIVKDLLIKKTGQMIFYFDELDKYLSYHIEYSFQQQKEVDDFEEYRRSYKKDFLYQLLEMIETTIYSDGVVFIFCSNNFHTIFEHTNQVHFNSLKSRFAPIRFERCNKMELIRYIRYFNEKMVDTRLYHDDETINALVSQIRDDVSLTYRVVRHCHISAGYDIARFIEEVNNIGIMIHSDPVTIDVEPKRVIKLKSAPISESSSSNGSPTVSSNGSPGSPTLSSNGSSGSPKVSSNGSLGSPTVSNSGSSVTQPLKGDLESKLINCAKNGDLDNLKLLIDEGVNINSVDSGWGSTALMFATQNNRVNCVQELLSAGADVHIRNKNGFTALHYSCDVNCMKLLLDAGSDINAQTNSGNTLLMFTNNTKCFAELLRLGVDVGIRNKNGETILHLTGSRPDDIKLAVEMGADINVQNNNGNTCLHIASGLEYYDTINVLLQLGADPSIQNNNGKTPDMLTSNQKIHDLLRSYQ